MQSARDMMLRSITSVLALTGLAACSLPHDLFTTTAYAPALETEFPVDVELKVWGGLQDFATIADVGDESGASYHPYRLVKAAFIPDAGSVCDTPGRFHCDGACVGHGILRSDGVCAGVIATEDDEGETWELQVCAAFASTTTLDGRPYLMGSDFCSVNEIVENRDHLDALCLELRSLAEDTCGG